MSDKDLFKLFDEVKARSECVVCVECEHLRVVDGRGGFNVGQIGQPTKVKINISEK